MNVGQPQSRLERWIWRWAKRRTPRASEVTLRHRNIYVLPNRAGLGFAFTAVLLWLLGTNYENNLVLAASFFLVALFVVCILHAFRNLAGLRVSARQGATGFAGERVDITVELTAPPGSGAEALDLAFEPGAGAHVERVEARAHPVTLGVKAPRRGWFRPERLLIDSHYPLGITKVWSWVRLDTRVLVYPQPRPAVVEGASSADEAGEQRAGASEQDDFIGFRPYQPGASLAQVAWKLYARGGGMHLKEYGGRQATSRWLDFAALAGDREARLSGLCYLALQYHREGRQFGLRLPGQTLAPATGEPHLERVLTALALFEAPEAS